MFVFTAQIILVISLAGMLFLSIRKIPALVVLNVEEVERKSIFKIIRKYKPDFSKIKRIKLPQRMKKDRKEKFDQEDDYWEKVTK